MDIRIVSAQTAIAEHRADWNRLVRESDSLATGQDATSTIEWFETLLESFAETATAQVVVQTDGGRVTGLLPVVQGNRSLPGRVLSSPTSLYGGRNGLLVEDDDPLHMRHLLAGLDRACGDWAELRLWLPEGSPSMDLLSAGPRPFSCSEVIESPWFPLADSSDAFWKACSRNTREQIRKSRSKLQARGTYACRMLTTVQDADALLEAVLEIERESWKETAGTAVTRKPQQINFYRHLFPRAMREGLLIGAVLYLDGQPIAHHFGLLRQQVFSCLKHSQKLSFDDARPSYLLNRYLIDALIERGVRRFDYMGQVEWHKMRWSAATSTYRRRACTLYRDGWRGRLAHELHQLKANTKRWLTQPAPAVATSTSDVQATAPR